MANKKHKKRKKKLRSVFPIIYPNRIGTPTTYRPGDTNEFGGQQPPAPTPPPSGGSGGGTSESYRPKPGRARILHEMRKAMGVMPGNDRANDAPDGFPATELKEYFGDSPQAGVGGFSVPAFASATSRGGGPFIGGPGFVQDYKGDTGRYDFQKSPGLGFRTEQAWRVWEQALKIMEREPNLAKTSILLRAMAKSGIYQGQIEPAEYRLLEMGVDWYLSDAGALGSRRDIFY